jgi:hypothetical protein
MLFRAVRHKEKEGDMAIGVRARRRVELNGRTKRGVEVRIVTEARRGRVAIFTRTLSGRVQGRIVLLTLAQATKVGRFLVRGDQRASWSRRNARRLATLGRAYLSVAAFAARDRSSEAA